MEASNTYQFINTLFVLFSIAIVVLFFEYIKYVEREKTKSVKKVSNETKKVVEPISKIIVESEPIKEVVDIRHIPVVDFMNVAGDAKLNHMLYVKFNRFIDYDTENLLKIELKEYQLSLLN